MLGIIFFLIYINYSFWLVPLQEDCYVIRLKNKNPITIFRNLIANWSRSVDCTLGQLKSFNVRWQEHSIFWFENKFESIFFVVNEVEWYFLKVKISFLTTFRNIPWFTSKKLNTNIQNLGWWILRFVGYVLWQSFYWIGRR